MIVFVMKAGGEEEEDRIGARKAEMRGLTFVLKKAYSCRNPDDDGGYPNSRAEFLKLF